MNNSLKRLGAGIIALLLVSYVCYQVYTYFHSTVELQTCRTHTVYDTLDVKGIAIRSEEILEQDTSGYIYYTLENGARVAKDGVIAEIYPSENDALAQKKLKELNAEISSLKTLQKQGTVSKTNLETLNGQISQTQVDMLSDVNLGKYQNLSTQRNALIEYLNRKQILTTKVADFDGRINSLEKEKSELESASHKASTGTITSPQPGYFVSSLDGYESLLKYDDVDSLTVDKIDEIMSKKVTSEKKSTVGKVVGNYEWFIACVVPTEKLGRIPDGANINVKLPFVSDETIPVEVEVVNRDKEKAALVLKCSYMSEALSSVRCEEIQILLTEYSGLFVPDEALQFDKDNNPGVFICTGTTLEFRHISILYHSEIGKYSICDATMGQAKLVSAKKENKKDNSNDKEEKAETVEEREYLKLYDDIVVGGKNLYEGKIVR